MQEHGNDWILMRKETNRAFASSTWIPLRAVEKIEKGNIKSVGYTQNFFGCGTVAFSPTKTHWVEQNIGWTSIGLIHQAIPQCSSDKNSYVPVDLYKYGEKDDEYGVHLIFDHPQPTSHKRLWILNPDLIIALRLIKEGNNWVRPEENFTVVAREFFDQDGNHTKIEIKKEFLQDYLAARNLFLRLSYYRQRTENVFDIEHSAYAELSSFSENRKLGQFELRINKLSKIHGGSWTLIRAHRTDFDEGEDVPLLKSENDNNTVVEAFQGERKRILGTRVDGKFWGNEWIKHLDKSPRIRGDTEDNLPNFIIDTSGLTVPSQELNNEEIGRWLWFRPEVIKALLECRGFTMEWCTRDTGLIMSTSGFQTHFGLNSADLVNVYASDIARLAPWEQRIWAAHNVSPDGKLSKELSQAQILVTPADTIAPESLLFSELERLSEVFTNKYGKELFTHQIAQNAFKEISRFNCLNRPSLLTLSKNLVRVFSDRLNVNVLKEISSAKNKQSLGSIKLFESIISQTVEPDLAHSMFSVVVGVYQMRISDAHPTSSNIDEAIKLAKIDTSLKYLRQGEQLIFNYYEAIRNITDCLNSLCNILSPSNLKEKPVE